MELHQMRQSRTFGRQLLILQKPSIRKTEPTCGPNGNWFSALKCTSQQCCNFDAWGCSILRFIKHHHLFTIHGSVDWSRSSDVSLFVNLRDWFSIFPAPFNRMEYGGVALREALVQSFDVIFFSCHSTDGVFLAKLSGPSFAGTWGLFICRAHIHSVMGRWSKCHSSDTLGTVSRRKIDQWDEFDLFGTKIKFLSRRVNISFASQTYFFFCCFWMSYYDYSLYTVYSWNFKYI